MVRVLDLFCGGGGASMGYHQAGFDVVGVDINYQPLYPFKFYRADALTFDLEGFDLINASPPCQRFSKISYSWPDADRHPDLLNPILKRLQGSGKWYVVENVPGAPLPGAVMLCGSMFGLGVQRHRLFRANFVIEQPKCSHNDYCVSVSGNGRNQQLGIKQPTIDEKQRAMGIDWLTTKPLGQAIPPAYTKYIAQQYLKWD